MADPTVLDGNAIGGLLLEIFGRDLTAAFGTCASCGARRQVAEFVVYVNAPGTVARCRDCDAVLIMITRHESMNCVDLTGLESLTT
jgi:hypothetical protein